MDNITHIVSIPSVEKYYDRLIMFCEIGKLFKKQHIYIRKQGGIITNLKELYPNTIFTVYKRNGGALDKAKSLYRFLKKTTNRNSFAIIHDIATP